MCWFLGREDWTKYIVFTHFPTAHPSLKLGLYVQREVLNPRTFQGRISSPPGSFKTVDPQAHPLEEFAATVQPPILNSFSMLDMDFLVSKVPASCAKYFPGPGVLVASKSLLLHSLSFKKADAKYQKTRRVAIEFMFTHTFGCRFVAGLVVSIRNQTLLKFEPCGWPSQWPREPFNAKRPLSWSDWCGWNSRRCPVSKLWPLGNPMLVIPSNNLQKWTFRSVMAAVHHHIFVSPRFRSLEKAPCVTRLAGPVSPGGKAQEMGAVGCHTFSC